MKEILLAAAVFVTVPTLAHAQSRTGVQVKAETRTELSTQAAPKRRAQKRRATKARTTGRTDAEVPPKVNAGASTDVKAGVGIGRGATGVTAGVSDTVGGVLRRP